MREGTQRPGPGVPEAERGESLEPSNLQAPPSSGERRTAIRRFFGRPQLRRLWPEVARARAADPIGGGRVVLTETSPGERLAIAGLFGLEMGSGPLELHLVDIETSLRASHFATGIEEVLACLPEISTDPPGDEDVPDLWAHARAHPAVQLRPRLGTWLDQLASSRFLLRLVPGSEGHTLEQALEVLAALPADSVRLPELAKRILGDSRALNAGKPIGQLVLGGLAVLAKRSWPKHAEARHQLWHWAGVLTDDLSTDVLAFGLTTNRQTAVDRAIAELAEAGEPARLTLRQVQAAAFSVPPGSCIYLCQTPAVITAAADHLGARSRPILCTGGLPNAAAVAVLTRLAGRGARLRYHGDFDWTGLRIANALYRTIQFEPWRFGVGDYIQACERVLAAPEVGGNPVYAVWDSQLTGAMVERAICIEEETVIDDLLDDLDKEKP